jgi:hypothetical protein
MLGSLTEELALTSRQLMLVHSNALRWVSRPLLPVGWTPGDFKTSGLIEEQRVKLELLASRIFWMQTFSFLCKIVSVATLRWAPNIDASRRSVIYSLTVLTVQVVPTALTMLLFSRYFFSRGSDSAKDEIRESAEDNLIDDGAACFSNRTTPMVSIVSEESAGRVEALAAEKIVLFEERSAVGGTRWS